MSRSTLFFAVLLGLSSCDKERKVTEVDVLGSWESTAVSKPFMKGLPSRNRIMFYKLGNVLIMGGYTNWMTAKISRSGDTLVLKDKCLHYVETLQIKVGEKAYQDTLVLGAFRKFTRIDDKVYKSGKESFLDGIYHRNAL